jgi:hypothetical protein
MLQNADHKRTLELRRCACDQAHELTCDQFNAFDCALARHKMGTVKSLDLPKDQEIELATAFSTHG